MIINKAELKDVQELNTLINSAYRGDESKKGWTTEAEILDGIRVDEAALKTLLTTPKVIILKCLSENGEILGSVCLELKADLVYLGMFAVAPVSQGMGIGKALLKAAEEFTLAKN